MVRKVVILRCFVVLKILSILNLILIFIMFVISVVMLSEMNLVKIKVSVMLGSSRCCWL